MFPFGCEAVCGVAIRCDLPTKGRRGAPELPKQHARVEHHVVHWGLLDRISAVLGPSVRVGPPALWRWIDSHLLSSLLHVQCSCSLYHIAGQEMVCLILSLGGAALNSASRTCTGACWTSWAVGNAPWRALRLANNNSLTLGSMLRAQGSLEMTPFPVGSSSASHVKDFFSPTQCGPDSLSISAYGPDCRVVREKDYHSHACRYLAVHASTRTSFNYSSSDVCGAHDRLRDARGHHHAACAISLTFWVSRALLWLGVRVTTKAPFHELHPPVG